MTRRAPRDPFGAVRAVSPTAARERLGGKEAARRLLKGESAGSWPDNPPVTSGTSAQLTAATETAADRLTADTARRTRKGNR